MTPADLLALTVRPVLDWMHYPYASPEAEVMLLAIAQQESGLRYRRQKNGTARGLWQFESVGIDAVLRHPVVGATAEAALSDLACMTDDPRCVMSAVEMNDQLACVFARLLLWTGPAMLPRLGQPDRAWNVYQSLWRPGKPRPEAWPASYAAALMAVEGSA